ncbi:MAG: glycosyltransferase [Candidatus Moranbacteria bacterium]|nr:glycosyltransferase [Candidatus Moranbacteria bacterium]
MLAGDGQELPKLKKMIIDAGLINHVIFSGIVKREITKNIFAAADIFVYASKSETQGMILTEAMCLGLPVVAVTATGSMDIVGNQITGLLVRENEDEFVNAVERLITDAELRKRFSENAEKIAKENYTAPICAKKMLEIYQKNIGTKK